MATMQPENLQPVCRVPGCRNGAQMLSIKGTKAVWMKTCRFHTYLDLDDTSEPVETFWPPTEK